MRIKVENSSNYFLSPVANFVLFHFLLLSNFTFILFCFETKNVSKHAEKLQGLN